MLEKISLTDKEYERIAKGIAFGVGVGVIVGAVVGNILLTFSAGGAIGVLVSFGLSWKERREIKKANIFDEE